MEKTKWTKEQLQAIKEKGKNILVAAGAGSGKTAVLVERIIQKILVDKIDIDKMLVVTFTNAAAAEMRERILDAIYKKLEEEPNNMNLQRQILLLNNASISTIHSFCLDIIKNNFYEIDISPNFRIADTPEIELLKQEILEDLFEELYDENDEEFLKLINTYTTYKGDDSLKDIILKIYNYIQSSPFPDEWLKNCVDEFNIDSNTDFAKTKWGKILLEDFKDEVNSCINRLEYINKQLLKYSELEKYSKIICEDIITYKYIVENIENWDIVYKKANQLEYSRWPSDKKITMELKDSAKKIRDDVKKVFKIKKDSILLCESKYIISDILEMYNILNILENVIIKFSERFEDSKKEKNIIDFSDIEHYALKLLLEKNEKGEYIPTQIAKKYREKFVEIAIDEYQDSNYVQENILKAISNGSNLFMVGDVKQSIYKFRQAIPELFLEKYSEYKDINEISNGDNLKIQLFKNFRSRKLILDLCNLVFKNIMTKKLGDIDYNEKEFLQIEKDYDNPEDTNINYAGKAELHIIDLKEEEVEDEEILEERLENEQIEARFIVNKIREILREDYFIFDKKEKKYRKATYKDIVILLRSTSNIAPVYEKELLNNGIPVFSDTSSEYLQSIEIETVMSVLRIIDNPRQDIPLVAVLRSPIGGFTDNELLKIRLYDKNSDFYSALKLAMGDKESKLSARIKVFIDNLENWRQKQEYLGLDELIWIIYNDTGYYNYVSLMPDGDLRIANLKMLFERAKEYESASFKGLFKFINFIDRLKMSSGDLGSAKIIGENENVVRIMSIHKSKGLEFPIVFLASTGKQFNMRDLNDNILLHQELGIGPKYINYEKRIEYNTLAREALRIKSRKEAISEEMRVLYVALTRSREKLIISGIDKDVEKSLKEKEEFLNMYGNINENLLEKYKSYLSWLELIYVNNKEELEKFMKICIHNKNEFLKNEKLDKYDFDFEDLINNKNSNKKYQIEEMLDWRYKYNLATKIPSKTSVTKIKELSKTKDDLYEKTLTKPKFLTQTDKLTNAEKGTLMHLCLQKMDINNINSKEDIIKMIEELVAKKIITENEAKYINIDKLNNFIHSNTANNMRNSKKIYKEVPFYININANEIYDEKSEEKILVQGIIDVYYIDKNDKIVLLDYKTDYVKSGEEKRLIDKYKEQLLLYKRAIEESTNNKVSKVCIYSIYLDKEINIKN